MMTALAILRGVPKPAWWVLVGILAAYGIFYAGDSNGYQRALQERADAVQKAKERADEIGSDIDSLDDDDLVNGLLKSD